MKDSYGNEFTNVASTTNVSVKAAAASAHSAIDSAAARAKPAIDRAATMAHDAAVKTADWVNDKSGQLSASEKQMIGSVTKYVNSNPLKAVGMALAAGAVLARIL